MLEIKNLQKTFGKKEVVKNVSFTIENDTILGFVGNNGAGKTTTIRLIFEIIDRDGGEVLFEGKSLTEHRELKSQIAFFPDQNNFPRAEKIMDYLVYNARLFGIKKDIAKKSAEDLLADLGLGDYLKAKFSDLSSGMQKKALLASVLITKPKLIILDEPTANVDVDTRVDFLNIIKELSKSGVAIMITTHIIDELQDSIDKLVILKAGEIVYNAKFDNKKEKISDIYHRFSDATSVDMKSIMKRVSEK